MRITENMLLFWRSHEIYCNWYPSGFVVDGQHFNCGEQWIMHAKASLFGDREIAAKILAEPHARRQKLLGRQVRGFDAAHWNACCEKLAFVGLLEKFRQNPALKAELLASGERLLAEASPDDRIWGIGLEEADPRALDSTQWQGENRLGKILMQVRTNLRASS
ncbi:MAG: GTP cyclohydrolase [Candidatus Dactylopiibacterium carminicum]|uniref:DUF1768 domain-containing protein n=2 Tax=Candidatus Dactylopiibacterium carminicum TaxID=857335 RepID=A0A272ESL1_9RHOO|nr:DUF1768 domain-containing protein [Candidatus Dactylopiibacterium carminicum]PAS93094.1 MAG: GTP cyclohydrolase [Candidatus Dactylopiibacterium carminicum]PAS99068.1 MAG: GTP cyclohydrolase [Candidatus Dactylopiibacterium carminicum]